MWSGFGIGDSEQRRSNSLSESPIPNPDHIPATIHPRDLANPPARSNLDAGLRRHLAAYKAPKSYDHLPGLPRDGPGKMRRSALVADRIPGTTIAPPVSS